MVMIVKTIDFTSIPQNLNKSVCCIGYFDGLHLGHQSLIQKCVEIAKNKELMAGLITFDPDPWKIFFPERTCKHITTVNDRIQLASNFGVDVFYIITFSKEFASLKVEDFHNLLKCMNVQHLVCGFDFKYGYKNSGNIETLKKQMLFPVSIVERVDCENEKISSSRIEPLICGGKVDKANQNLGYIYSLHGIIEHGFKRGSKLLDIPTANLKVDEEYLIPSPGVYAGYVSVKDRLYGAMINVGNNPTFENKKVTIEAYIFDFNENIYNLDVRFYFQKKTRNEIKFNSFLDLKDQLNRDIVTCKKAIQENPYLLNRTCELWNTNFFEFHSEF